MQLLQWMNGDGLVFSTGGERLDQSLGPGHRRYARHVVLQRGAADCLFVEMRRATERRIDYQSDVTLFDIVGDIGPAFIYFEDRRAFQTDFAQARGSSDAGHQLKTQSREAASKHDRLALVGVIHTDESGATARQVKTGGRH